MWYGIDTLLWVSHKYTSQVLIWHILSICVFLCICAYAFPRTLTLSVYHCSCLTTKGVYSILDNIAGGCSDTGSERSVVIQDLSWRRIGDWAVIVKKSVRSCGLEQSVGGQRSAVHVDVLDIRKKRLPKAWWGEMTAANSSWRSKSAGTATLSVVGQSKGSLFLIHKDQAKNCWRVEVSKKKSIYYHLPLAPYHLSKKHFATEEFAGIPWMLWTHFKQIKEGG